MVGQQEGYKVLTNKEGRFGREKESYVSLSVSYLDAYILIGKKITKMGKIESKIIS